MRDSMSKYWRPFGCWMLTLNAAFGFPIILYGLIFVPEANLGVATGLYGSVLATWVSAAGIRQWGKNNGSELKGD